MKFIEFKYRMMDKKKIEKLSVSELQILQKP